VLKMWSLMDEADSDRIVMGLERRFALTAWLGLSFWCHPTDPLTFSAVR